MENNDKLRLFKVISDIIEKNGLSTKLLDENNLIVELKNKLQLCLGVSPFYESDLLHGLLFHKDKYINFSNCSTEFRMSDLDDLMETITYCNELNLLKLK